MEENKAQKEETKGTGTNMKLVIAFIAGILIIGAGAVYALTQTNIFSPQPTSNEKTTSQITQVTKVPVKTEGTTSMEIQVEAGEFFFEPKEIQVKKGETVRITLRNTGTKMHNWVIDEFDAATTQIGPGETETIEFVADQSGEFEFYCSVGNHRQLGMVGTLIVE